MPDGLLILHKPSGLTSHDVVNRVRRVTGLRRVGHAGTLDPLATGVLVICLGQATRISEYLLGHAKTYRATIRLGIETDTYDVDGQVTATHSVEVDDAKLRAALDQFIGDIQQIPPMHSALKQQGRKLYELARAGIEVDRPARSVTIHSIELIDFRPPDITIEVHCSAGTYIRSLAHDLGEQLGCGAHLIALERRAAGPFTLSDAIELDRFEASADWQAFLKPIDLALADWPSVTLDASQSARAVTGGPIEGLNLQADRCCAYNQDRQLIALLIFDTRKGCWRADKVLAHAA
jgi:tRNA pseudouridine55 synthase